MSHCCGPKDKGLGFLLGKSPEETLSIVEEQKDKIIFELGRTAQLLFEGDNAGMFGDMRVGEGDKFFNFSEIAGKIVQAAIALLEEPVRVQLMRLDVANGIFYAALFSTYANKIERIKEANGGKLPSVKDLPAGPFKGGMMTKRS